MSHDSQSLDSHYVPLNASGSSYTDLADLQDSADSADSPPAFLSTLTSRLTLVCQKKHISKMLILTVLLGLCTYFIVDTFTAHRVVGAMLDLNKWVAHSGQAGCLYMILILTMATIVGLPVTVFCIGGAFAFSEEYGRWGLLVNVITCYIGCLLGAALSFLLGRYFFRKSVRAYIRKKKLTIVRAVDIALKNEGTKMSCLLRLVPYIPWNIFNYVAGVTGMRFHSFVIGSVGMFPWIAICTFIGSGIKSLDDAASGASSGSDKRVTVVILVVGLVSTVVTTAMVSVYARRALKESEEEAGRNSASSFTFNGSREPSRDVGAVPEQVRVTLTGDLRDMCDEEQEEERDEDREDDDADYN